MNQTEALNVLISTAHLAQRGGALTLENAKIVLEAIEAFKPKEDNKAVDNTEPKQDETVS